MSENNSTAKVITILDYFGILWILGLFVEKDNPAVKFHTNQGLILFIYDMIVGVASVILAFIPFVGGIIAGLLSLSCFVLMILGIVNAAKGQCKPLPIIGGLFNIIR